MKKYESLIRYLSVDIIENEKEISNFIDDIYSLVDRYPEYGLNNYIDILKENNIKWGMADMINVDAAPLDEKAILALLVGAVRADRFCDGAFCTLLEEGQIYKWLTKLKEFKEA